MTVSENLLFQMYQMMESVKLPEVTTSTSGKESEKSSFQDLMEQTRKDAATSETTTQNEDEVNQAKQSDKTTEKTDSKPSEPEKEEPKLENTNYAALSYLLRPEIRMVSEEAVKQVTQQPLAVTVEGENPVQTLIPTEVTTVPEPLVPTQQNVEGTETLIPAQQSQETTLIPSEAPQSQFTQTMQVESEKTDAPKSVDTSPVNTQEEEKAEAEGLITSDTPSQPLFREVETAPVKVGENYQLDTTSTEMDTDLTNIIKDADVQGLQKVEIQLTPANLGKIVVELTRNADGVLQVAIHAANAKSAGLLSQHLDNLNSALQNLGHSQVHVEVQRNEDSASAQQHPFQQADPDGRGQHPKQQRQDRQSQSDSDDFLQQLRLGLFSLDESI